MGSSRTSSTPKGGYSPPQESQVEHGECLAIFIANKESVSFADSCAAGYESFISCVGDLNIDYISSTKL